MFAGGVRSLTARATEAFLANASALWVAAVLSLVAVFATVLVAVVAAPHDSFRLLPNTEERRRASSVLLL